MILHMISWINLWYHRLARCTEYHMICVYDNNNDIILNQNDIIYHHDILWYEAWYHTTISYMISYTHMIWYCLWYHIWYHIMSSQWVQRRLRSPLQRQGLAVTLKHALWEHKSKKIILVSYWKWCCGDSNPGLPRTMANTFPTDPTSIPRSS